MGAQEEPPRASILEELLLALLGHAGDIFLDHAAHEPDKVAEPSLCTFRTAEDLDFVSPSNRQASYKETKPAKLQPLHKPSKRREVMNGIVELGFHYQGLEVFVQREEFAWSREGGSQYRCALANGIRELLDVYSAAILQVQQQLREAVNPSLATLNYFLTEFKVLLPSVHQIAYQVHVHDLKGSAVLRALHNKACCGIAEVQSCLERLQWHCHQTLLKHLKAWMVHGLLVDHNEEFFIQRASLHKTAPTPPSAGVRAEQASNALEWHQGFEVRPDLLPPGVLGETAQSILFIGKAVRVLTPADGDTMGDPLGAAAALDALQGAPAFDAAYFELVVENIREQAAKKLWQLVVVQGEMPLHLAALRNYLLLGRGDFWQSFLLESHSLMSLPAMRATAEANIRLCFQQSAAKSSAEGDPLFSKVSIRIPASESGAASNSSGALPTPALPSGPWPAATPMSSSSFMTGNPFTLPRQPAMPTAGVQAARGDATPAVTPQTGESRAGRARRGPQVPDYDPKWDALTLAYEVQWPLHLLLSPEVLPLYGRLFQYLFRLKRLQLELDLAWAALSRQEGGLLWRVRGHMAHIVNNLQLYMQADVIEVQFAKLVAALAELRDLKAASRAHEEFLTACTVQSCLDVPQFSIALANILATCKAFCAYVQKQERSRGSFQGDPLLQQPKRLVEDFQRNSRLLYRLLSSPTMHNRARAPFLRLLQLRLNFNDFMQQDMQRHAPAAHAPVVAA